MFIFDPFTWGLLAMLFWAIAFITIKSRRSRRKQLEVLNQFLEEEDEANAARRRPIQEELFYKPQLDQLPPLPDDDPHKITRAANRKMIHFPKPMTNAELKARYGRVQLEQLAQYEENYEDYLRALTKWATQLVKDNQTADAKRILEQTVALSSEFRNSYKLLADIYADERSHQKLDELLAAAQAKVFKDPTTGLHVVGYIREKRSKD